MGTRGAVGFRIDGQDKVAYNHFDSYPSGLGQDVVNYLKKTLFPTSHFAILTNAIDELKNKVRQIDVVNQEIPPTTEQIEKFSKFANTVVSTGKLTEWYVLLRNLQGDLEGYIEAGVIIDAQDFLNDSLFCEYAYIVNLDTEKLEVYRGFQTKPHTQGRYSTYVPTKESGFGDKYHAVALIAEIPFSDIINIDDIEKALPKEEEEVNAG